MPVITEALNRHMAHASSVSSALLMLSLLALVEPGADAISDEAAHVNLKKDGLTDREGYQILVTMASKIFDFLWMFGILRF